MEINGNAKKGAIGTVAAAVLAILGLGTTEATGTTNFLGGLSKEQVLDICATPEQLRLATMQAKDELRPVSARAEEAWRIAGDARLSQYYEQLSRARYSLDQARKANNLADIRYWEAEIQRIEREIRKLGG